MIILLKDRYSKAQFLTMGDFHLRIGERQVELPHLFGVRENSNAEICNCANKRSSKDTSWNQQFQNPKWDIWTWYKKGIYFY